MIIQYPFHAPDEGMSGIAGKFGVLESASLGANSRDLSLFSMKLRPRIFSRPKLANSLEMARPPRLELGTPGLEELGCRGVGRRHRIRLLESVHEIGSRSLAASPRLTGLSFVLPR